LPAPCEITGVLGRKDAVIADGAISFSMSLTIMEK
jgi:hypothetical protein